MGNAGAWLGAKRLAAEIAIVSPRAPYCFFQKS
jgi:hypothetical protein